MSRRRIQQLREAGARRHGNGRDDDDYDDNSSDDELPTNNTALRMSRRRIRSVDDVIDRFRLHKSTAFKVGVVCFNT